MDNEIIRKKYSINFEEWLLSRLEMSNHDGYKSKDLRGDERLQTFINWLFNTKNLCDTIIISGHSLWLRKFFQAYLPNKFNYDGKTQKIVNGGVIACEFTKYELQNQIIRYKIEPNSCQTIVGGFEAEKKRKVL